MKPLKTYFKASVCLWDGHKETLGTAYSPVYGRRIACICCARCYKFLYAL